MNTFARSVSKQIGRLVPAKTLFRRTAPVFLPFYHVVSNDKLPHILNYPYRNVADFEKELDFFLKHFEPVSLDELIENSESSSKIFHLSFDDGLRECAEIIAPVLQQKGISATFFINPGFVGNKQLFHKYKASLILSELQKKPNKAAEKILQENKLSGRKILQAEFSQIAVLDQAAEKIGIDFEKFLQNQEPYLTVEQTKKLAENGFSIGAHSFDHPEFWKISSDEQLGQIRKSMDWISANIPQKIKAFAFPFTDSGVPAPVLKTIEKEQICDITFGTAGVKYDEFKFHFQRYPMEQPGNFKLNLKGEFMYYELRKLIGKDTVRH
ncbi:Polysaccharide deacetylase [Tangfeifania diversioriginum]|uniref:Polysaccharide deacetylase n=1 Tax=Tangfeifania diversioriginum TaxID=1168035 RepID=A0A1M6GN75_9BACT|nr:polysaccharide deacetylase family protein [Tangfeifania diversioriginum]SHJ11320.1 Polysaccharide deacetylase [Tangfeifania diversioriginum]